MTNLKSLSNEQILSLKIKELDPKLGPEQRSMIEMLNNQLRALGIKWRPHHWFSQEWFSPDGVSGFAIPFMLTHKKLIKLEKEHLGTCEGESMQSFYKLICHETAHAIDNAYKLRLNKKRQELFGLSSTSYPSSYRPNPSSLNYISFLGDHYAQAHPDEDWAETFGHYLMHGKLPDRYKGTRVEEKYHCVHQIVSSLKNKEFKANEWITPENYRHDNMTIGEYLEKKKKSLKLHKTNYFEKKIVKKFQDNREGILVSSFMRIKKKSIINKLTKRTNHHPWVLSKSFDDLAKECKNKNYSFKSSNQISEQKIEQIIFSNIDDYVKKGRTRIYM